MARRLGAAKHVGPHLTHPKPRGPTRAIDPAVRHLAVAAQGKCGSGVPHDAEVGPRARRQQAVGPYGGHEHRICDEHAVECPGNPEAGEAEQCEARAEPERPPGAQDHAVGTSVLSRIALSAASAVTPSSSSSGATLTR